MSDDRGADDAADREERSDNAGDASSPASAAARRERRGGSPRPAGTGKSGQATAAGRRSAGAGDDRGVAESLWSRLVRYLREVVAELQKVIWPTRKQLVNYTAVVLVFLVVMVTFVALLDMGFGRIIFYVFGE